MRIGTALRSRPIRSDVDLHEVAVRRNSGGVRAKPTPSGVPVAMTSPGSSVMPLRELRDQARDREDHLRRVAVLLLDAVEAKGELEQICGSPISSGVTIHGPDRAAVVEALALEPLTVAALQIARRHVVERGVSEDDVERVVLGTFLQRAPMTTASSASKSYSLETLARGASVAPGAAMAVGALVKNVGTLGKLELAPGRARAFAGMLQIVAADAEDVACRTTGASSTASASGMRSSGVCHAMRSCGASAM